MSNASQFDVLIAGGGPAGLSAALILGRSCRRVLVCRGLAQASRHVSHGLFGHDGETTDDILAKGIEQLAKYSNVEIVAEEVVSARRLQDGIAFRTSANREGQARRIILATGVSWELPNTPGLSDMWGKSVFVCPYCHAWDYRGQPMAILSNGLRAFQLCSLMAAWSHDLVVCTQGPANLEPHQRVQLERREIRIIELPIARFEGPDGQLERIVFQDGNALPRRAAVMCISQKRNPRLATQLGLLKQNTLKLHDNGQTDDPLVYVAGDLGNQHFPRMLASAIYSGTAVGERINESLAIEDFQT